MGGNSSIKIKSILFINVFYLILYLNNNCLKNFNIPKQYDKPHSHNINIYANCISRLKSQERLNFSRNLLFTTLQS